MVFISGLFYLLLFNIVDGGLMEPVPKCPEAYCVCSGPNDSLVEVVCDRGGLSDQSLAKLIQLIPKNVNVIRLEAPLTNPNNFSLTQDFARFVQLTELHFVNGALSSLGKRTFENLKNLKILNLSGNQIEHLSPETFINMEHLEQLSLSRNTLNRRQKLPTGTFVYLRNLHTLDLSENSVGEFAPNLFYGLQNLLELNLRGNSFAQADFDLLYDLPNLRILNLADCDLNLIPATAFKNNLELRQLNLAGNQLTSVKILAPKLEFLNLSYNSLKFISKSAFVGTPNLKRLHLAGNSLGISVTNWSQMSTVFHQGAFHNLQLEELNLANNSFKYFDSLNLNIKSLQSLDLSNNPFQFITAKMTSGLFNLHTLRLSEIELKSLPNRLPLEYANLKTLDLSGNHLDAFSYDNVQFLKSLETLDISRNRFTYLPEYMLSFFNTLKLIYLHNNSWDCHCQINGLREFLLAEKMRNLCGVMRYDRITCSTPASVSGKPVALLDKPADCSKYFGAAGLSKSSEMGLLIAGVCGLLLLLGLVTAVACSYFWPRATYRTNEEKANLSTSSSEHSNLQPTTTATRSAKQVERLF